jgi:hypothetical protein
MKRGRVVKTLGYFLIGVLLAGMAGRSSLLGGDGGPSVRQLDVREDPARDLIQGLRKAVKRFRGAAVAETTGHSRLQARRICDEDGGQTP